MDIKNTKKNSNEGYFETKIRRRRQIIESFKSKERESRSFFDVLADSMTSWFGTITFLLLNAAFFGIWILINIGDVPGIKPFDPFPFGFLTMIVSLEAIFLSIIVLISQNRDSDVSSLTDEMDMNIDLISEEEITKILDLISQIAQKNGIDTTKDHVLTEMLKPLNKDSIEEDLRHEITNPSIFESQDKK